MKKILMMLAIVLMAFSGQAQDAPASKPDQEKLARMMELMSQPIAMEVDTELFQSMGANSYVSENPKAVIMAMMIPDTYANTKEKMNNDLGDKFMVTEKGETEMNGVKVLFIKGTSEAEGALLNNEMYCMEIDAETCMMFVGVVDQTADQKYVDAIAKAKNSVIKKQ